VRRKWRRISLREYQWVDEPSLLVCEIARYRKDFWTTLYKKSKDDSFPSIHSNWL
jgi:hypothetical protein